MTFDIHRPLTREYGEIDEAAAEAFEAELLEGFDDSPEMKPILEGTDRVCWAGLLLEYARLYEGVTVTTMGKRALSGVLLELFPRNVSCEPSSAPEIVAELRAFWSFLRRELELPNADECLAVLDAEMTQTLERELANPKNYGMAKSFVMGGMAAGFDMTTEEGMNAFMLLQNATAPAIARGLAPASGPQRAPTQAEKNKKKAQRGGGPIDSSKKH
jgi:hypothetical protein